MSAEQALGRERIIPLIFRIGIPAMLAQFVSVLYSVVDRMFVGNIPGDGALALAGVGVCGPVVTLIGAFASLVGIGGQPLMGIAMGEGKRVRAERILANCVVMLVATALIVMTVAFVLKGPMLRLFGASGITYPYASDYFTVYVSGTVFALLSVGLAPFIVAQGFGRTGMFSVILGAALNIALDPLFIFVFDMGVRGAALATVLSQVASASFVLWFLFRKTPIRITFGHYSRLLMMRVLAMGSSPFTIIALDNVMLIAMNAVLQHAGGEDGDLLISVNTVAQSFMLVLTMPLGGLTAGVQCILSYNFGAAQSKRVLATIGASTLFSEIFTAFMLLMAWVASPLFVSLFTGNPELTEQSCRAIRICSAMALPLGIQYAVIDSFTGMGLVRFALPLSLCRKTIYFVSLTVLPFVVGASSAFYAYPISDLLSCCVTVPLFFCTIRGILRRREDQCRRRASRG